VTVSARHQTWAPVVSSREVAPSIFELVVRAPQIAAAAKPGQFVHLRVRESFDPLLRRPLSIGFVEGGTIGLLYRLLGHGTRILSEAVAGEPLDLLGPLGSPFTLHADRPAVMVAGGLGIADFPFLAEQLRAAGCPRMDLLYGARTEPELAWLERVQAEGAAVHPTTDDGSMGHQGPCTDLLPALVGGARVPPAIYACGPEPMFRAILRLITDPTVPIQLAHEQRMGCGFGACIACSVETNQGYLRACTEGPVFDGALFR
jgi:dihydroorotate dehydrogenase electron transfer subunit